VEARKLIPRKTRFAALLIYDLILQKSNGKKVKKPESSDEDEDDSDESGSEEDSSSQDESEIEKPSKEESDDDDDDDEDDSDGEDEDDSDDEEEAKKGKKPVAKAKAVKPAAKNDDEDDDDENDEDEDSSEEESEEDEEDKEETEKPSKPVAGQKRKDAPTESEETPAKRAKPDESASSSLFVGNLSWNVDEDWLQRTFESIGGVTGARIITDRNTGRPKGFGYVDFETAEHAQKAMELNGTDVDGRPLKLDLAQSKPAGGEKRTFNDKISAESATLFVGNMSFNATQDSLFELFAEAGEVVSVRIPTDRDTGEVKGYNSLI
jgi:nucleolin